MTAAPAGPRAPPERPQPGISAVLSHGWETLKEHFWTLIVATLIYVAVEGVSNVFSIDIGPGGPQQPLSLLTPLYTILISGPLLVGFAHLLLRGVRGEEPEIDDLLAGFRTYVNAVGGMLLYGLAVVVGLVLLIVPGLIAMVRLAFTPYMIVDRDLGPVDAVKASWEATRGHGWTLFGLLIVSLLILLGGLLLLLVGVVPAIAWVGTSWATYYDRATDDRVDAAGPASPLDRRPVGP